MKYKVAVIVVSDRCARGERKDQCLPEFERHLDRQRFDIGLTRIVSDEVAFIAQAVQDAVENGCHLIFTAGGTGCAARDVTPEAIRPMLDKPTPGIDEAIRAFSRDRNQNAIFSRGISGIVGSSLVVSLPGSPKAVAEILRYLTPLLAHPLALLSGKITDCNVSELADD